MKELRPGVYLACMVAVVLFFDLLVLVSLREQTKNRQEDVALMRHVVEELGISDLAIATEARYTRHPAVSDRVVPFMDHPGAIEHFPTGSFWRPVQ